MLTILLDDSQLAGHGARLYRQPRAIVRADSAADVPAALASLAAGIAAGRYAAGFLAYELGLVLEPRLQPLLPNALDQPLLLFGLYDAPLQLTEAATDAWLAESTGELTARLRAPPEPRWSRADYLTRFAKAKAAIVAGDIYQLNLTLEAVFAIDGPPLSLYRQLRRSQRIAHGAVVMMPEQTILSLSPELFLEINDRIVMTRPMKGTAARAPTLNADRDVARALAADPKSRAENLMIVDLMRNDLGRIAEIGSVTVPDLFTVETLRTLHQMTSSVTAQLKPGISVDALLAATFPAGSITGAPKIRAMEIIAALEGRARGIYCGSIGSLDPDGRGRFNVAIRTLTLTPDGGGRIGVGSGVVADSDGAAEYDECLLKMRFLTADATPFGLFETLRLEHRTYVLQARHMARLAASAAFFGFRWDAEAVSAALQAEALEAGDGVWRVRLDLAEDGRITTRRVAFTDDPAPFSFIVAREPVKVDDVFLYHKTTRRALYDTARRRLARRMPAIDEMVFLNAEGAVAEGTITNVFVERGGVLLTPPVSAGLLPGTLRAELLATGRAREAALTRQDLETAKVWLGNALRGLKPALYCGDEE